MKRNSGWEVKSFQMTTGVYPSVAGSLGERQPNSPLSPFPPTVKNPWHNSPGFVITMASCQALYHNFVFILVPYSKVTNPRFMRYNLHILLCRFQPLFGHLACICVWFASFSVFMGTYLRVRARSVSVILLWNNFADLSTENVWMQSIEIALVCKIHLVII